MTFSVMHLGDDYSELDQFLFAPFDLDRTKTEFLPNGYSVIYEVQKGTELYMTCESEIRNASYAYGVYKWNWKEEDWDLVDSCVTYFSERQQRIEECIEVAKQTLYNLGFVQAC